MRGEKTMKAPINEIYEPKVTRKWEPYLRDVEGEEKKIVLAQILENQERYFLTETTKSADVDDIARTIFPVVKKVWKDSILDHLVSVQPVKSTLSYIRYMKFTFAETAGDATAGEELGRKNYKTYSAYAGGHKTPACWTGDNPAPEGGAARGVNVELKREPVQCCMRALSAGWTFFSDIIAKMDEEEDLDPALIDAVAKEIRNEIEYQVIADLLANATGSTGRTWSWNASKEVGENARLLYRAILMAAADISKKIFASPNVLVMSPTNCANLESGEQFSVVYGKNAELVGIGRRLFGVINNRFKVIEDPLFPDNKILIGFKGGSIFEAGYVYCPCVPLFVTDKYFDPDELTYKRVLANISANKAIEMGSTPAWGYNYYGYLTIS